MAGSRKSANRSCASCNSAEFSSSNDRRKCTNIRSPLCPSRENSAEGPAEFRSIPAENARGLIDDRALVRCRQLPPRRPANPHHLMQNAVTFNSQRDSRYLVGNSFRHDRFLEPHPGAPPSSLPLVERQGGPDGSSTYDEPTIVTGGSGVRLRPYDKRGSRPRVSEGEVSHPRLSVLWRDRVEDCRQRQCFNFGQSCARVPNFAPLQIKTSILFSNA